MTTLVKIIIAAILSLSLTSCNFDINFSTGVKGNGNVITKERAVSESFSAIKATEGLNVYITQGGEEHISVEADENLHDLILTDIENGVLRIHAKQNIGNASAKKIHVNFKEISKIISTSGSSLHATNTISTNELELKTTSGSSMKLEVNTSSLNCNSTSGSSLRVSGETEKLIAEATSGSDIKAGNLEAESSHVKASSGADVTVNTSKELTAKATSGADIKYYGNPEKVSKSNNVSGSIRKR